MEADGEKKLSKRFASTSVQEAMRLGQSPESILGEAAWLAGLQAKNEPLTQRDLTQLFL
jgi:hypothetical protein